MAGTEPPRAVLWLEGVHMDFGAGRVPRLDGAVLEHAVTKAVAMGVALSVDTYMKQELAREAHVVSRMAGKLLRNMSLS